MFAALGTEALGNILASTPGGALASCRVTVFEYWGCLGREMYNQFAPSLQHSGFFFL